MNKWVIRFSALSALVVTPVLADDLTITTATTEPVTTAEAAGGTAGDITITDAGSIELGVLPIPDGEDAAPASVPAVTLNSDNSVTNDGAATVRHFNDPVGILIEGGNTGDFTLGGSIVVEGSDDGLDSTTNDENTTNDSIGLLLDEAGTFTGNIVTGAGSTITARGETATGIFLQSQVGGDVLLDGSTMAIGAGSVGVRTTDSITGTFRNSGSITSEPRDDGDGTFVPATAGSGLFIGGNVGEGILNDGPNGGAAPIAHIGTQGSAPALRISPALEFVADQEIENLTELGLEDYSFANRGDIIAQPIWPGIDAMAIQIGGSDDFMTTFSGDFYNSGAIRALSTSDDANATLSPLFPSDAIAIFFDARSSAPELHNTASGIIEAMTDGLSGGNTLAINIADSASLPS